jgi:hypothetical protein
LRSFDELSHSYLGYNLKIVGSLELEEKEFIVAVGKAAHLKFQFKIGDKIIGEGVRVPEQSQEISDIYKVSKLKVIEKGNTVDLAPALETYRERGHRRLDPRTFQTKCQACIWGCLMPVEIIIDKWHPEKVKSRRETFCYGPKNCEHYKAGANRQVKGKHGDTWIEEDWVDEDRVGHRKEGE